MPRAASDLTCVQNCPLQCRKSTERPQAGVQGKVAPAAPCVPGFGRDASYRQQHDYRF